MATIGGRRHAHTLGVPHDALWMPLSSVVSSAGGRRHRRRRQPPSALQLRASARLRACASRPCGPPAHTLLANARPQDHADSEGRIAEAEDPGDAVSRSIGQAARKPAAVPALDLDRCAVASKAGSAVGGVSSRCWCAPVSRHRPCLLRTAGAAAAAAAAADPGRAPRDAAGSARRWKVAAARGGALRALLTSEQKAELEAVLSDSIELVLGCRCPSAYGRGPASPLKAGRLRGARRTASNHRWGWCGRPGALLAVVVQQLKRSFELR